MPLIQFADVSHAFGGPPVLEKVSFLIEPGERVCLVGRNGAGKSTLLALARGDFPPDDGQVLRDAGVRVGHLAQALPGDQDDSVFTAVAGGLPEVGRLLAEYHEAAHQVAVNPADSKALTVLERLQQALEARDGWRLNQRVETVLSRLELDPDARVGSLSGGWRRRVLLGRALVTEPDLLLLDEPTNHLDIEAIEWLEGEVQAFSGGVLFVTHDRRFLERTATRILELDRGRLSSWPGNYQRYLERREARLAEEAKHNAEFDKRLAQEEVWIRKGIEARRTRNEGRVRALLDLRNQRRERRDLEGKARFDIQEAERSGKLVIETKGLTHALGGRTLVRNLDLTVMRGDRIGLIGPNGVGKTTLLRLLLGELTPDAGSVRHGTKLQVAYFDQARERLDDEASVADNVGQGRDFIEIGNERRHIMGYLQEFLFAPERARSPVRALSGGERNRVLLARLFSQPANVVVMDEPTNDLDVETLELLEERLLAFQGTLLVVSHDRAFLDNVVTSTVAFEPGGRVAEYVGGYSDWLRQRPVAAKPGPAKAATAPVAAKTAPTAKPAKLSYNQQRELDQLPARIEALEAEQHGLTEQTSDPAFYTRTQDTQRVVLERLSAIERELEQAYSRWDELESMRAG